MDLISLSDTALPSTPAKIDPLLGMPLKLNQIIEAKLLERQIALDNFTLQIDGKILQVKADRPNELQSGQPLRLQVVKLGANPEFKILPEPVKNNTQPPAALILRTIAVAPEAGQVSPAPAANLTAVPLTSQQELVAPAVRQVSEDKLSLSSLADSAAKPTKTQAFPAADTQAAKGPALGEASGVLPQHLLPLANGQPRVATVIQVLPGTVSFRIEAVAELKTDTVTVGAAETVSRPMAGHVANPAAIIVTVDNKQLQFVSVKVQEAANFTLKQPLDPAIAQPLQVTGPATNRTGVSQPVRIDAPVAPVFAQVKPDMPLPSPSVAPSSLPGLSSESVQGQKAPEVGVTLEQVKLAPHRQEVSFVKVGEPLADSDRVDERVRVPELSVGSKVEIRLSVTDGNPVIQVRPQIDKPEVFDERQLAAAVRRLLPLQDSPIPLMQQLLSLEQNARLEPTVAETLKYLARQILDSVPSLRQLTEANELRRVVTQSGLFMESKLAEAAADNAQVNLQDDLKVKLGKLMQFIEKSPALPEPEKTGFQRESAEVLQETLRKAESTHARLSLDQLNSLPREDSAKQSWMVEIPFYSDQQPSALKLVIEHERHSGLDSGEERNNWAVSISITPPNLGTIHCRISCYDGSVNTRFWSEVSATVDTINAHLDELKRQLEAKGLKMGFMEAHQGQPLPTSVIRTATTGLISEKV